MTGFLRARPPHAMTATFPCSGIAPDSLILHAAKRTGHDAAYELFQDLLYRNTGKSQLQSTPERIVPGRRFALCLLTAILRGIRLLVALFQRVHIFNKAPRRRRQAVIRAFRRVDGLALLLCKRRVVLWKLGDQACDLLRGLLVLAELLFKVLEHRQLVLCDEALDIFADARAVVASAEGVMLSASSLNGFLVRRISVREILKGHKLHLEVAYRQLLVRIERL